MGWFGVQRGVWAAGFAALDELVRDEQEAGAFEAEDVVEELDWEAAWCCVVSVVVLWETLDSEGT